MVVVKKEMEQPYLEDMDFSDPDSVVGLIQEYGERQGDLVDGYATQSGIYQYYIMAFAGIISRQQKELEHYQSMNDMDRPF